MTQGPFGLDTAIAAERLVPLNAMRHRPPGVHTD